jgi:hypothetical protein
MSAGFIPTVNTNFLMNNISGQTSTTPTTSGLLISAGSTNYVGGRFAIMKGTVPLDFSTLTSYSARSADTLILFQSSAATTPSLTNEFSPSQQNVNPMVITTIYVNATASGTATWFWWFTTPRTGVGIIYDNAILPYNQIVGTVGITGSGADLTLPSVTITSGNAYRIVNYRLEIPTSWTF